MSTALYNHIKRYTTLTEEEQAVLSAHLSEQSLRKKTHVLKEGEICRANYFVVKGCLRAYFINEKGGEQTCQFAIENWWITDYMSFDTQTPSHFFIQTVEPTEVIVLTKKMQDDLLAKIPKLEKYFRLLIQRTYAASQLRIKYLFSQSGEERYHHFNESFPEFVQRVPQYMLASYLGFSPEFLSKIRSGKT